jgi:flagellar hook-length control protein FliK
LLEPAAQSAQADVQTPALAADPGIATPALAGLADTRSAAVSLQAPTEAAAAQHAAASATHLAPPPQPPTAGQALLQSTYVMGSAAWHQETGAHVAWMRDDDVHHAELRLHPAELGSLEISINVQDDRAVVHMVAGNAHARDLLEASLPRLRELLASNGLQLDQGSVAQGQAHSGRQDAQAGFTRGGSRQHAGNETLGVTAAPAPRRGASLHRIDHYV